MKNVAAEKNSVEKGPQGGLLGEVGRGLDGSFRIKTET